jgi:hypothetical protein
VGPGGSARLPRGQPCRGGTAGREIDYRVRHEGAVIALDTVVKNVSTTPVTDAAASAELVDGAARLLEGEDSAVRPDRFEPGQHGRVLIAAPCRAGITEVRYLFAWQQAGREHHRAA